MFKILSIILGIASISWFFYEMSKSIFKSPIISFSASIPVLLVIILTLGFFLYDVYDHIKKIKK